MKIGIDLGGTKTEGIVLDNKNTVLKTIRRLTPQSQGYQAIVNNTVELIYELEHDLDQQCSIGIGTPGSIENETGLLKYSNTVCLNDQPLLADLEAKLYRSVRIENDANCFALSESVNGNARDQSIVFGVIMGTGVGGGLVINNKIVKGPNSMTGEWGHTLLDENGRKCFCGLNGCIETFLSGPGLIQQYIENGGPVVSRVEDLIAHAQNNDAIALTTLDGFYTHFAKAISQIIKIIDPEVIVMGGGLSNINSLYTLASQRIKNFVAYPIKINIVKNKHGDSSGVRGAAYLWD